MEYAGFALAIAAFIFVTELQSKVKKLEKRVKELENKAKSS
jgi:polyhydroxyalkanoate synthesis regulator phasin